MNEISLDGSYKRAEKANHILDIRKKLNSYKNREK